jgi:hypothetical protein
VVVVPVAFGGLAVHVDPGRREHEAGAVEESGRLGPVERDRGGDAASGVHGGILHWTAKAEQPHSLRSDAVQIPNIRMDVKEMFPQRARISFAMSASHIADVSRPRA